MARFYIVWDTVVVDYIYFKYNISDTMKYLIVFELYEFL